MHCVLSVHLFQVSLCATYYKLVDRNDKVHNPNVKGRHIEKSVFELFDSFALSSMALLCCFMLHGHHVSNSNGLMV